MTAERGVRNIVYGVILLVVGPLMLLVLNTAVTDVVGTDPSLEAALAVLAFLGGALLAMLAGTVLIGHGIRRLIGRGE